MTELSQVLNRVREWLFRFVIVPDHGDLDTVTLWIAHTWCLDQTATTPRLLIDSSTPESGKTTLLEHINALSSKPLLAASLSSPALMTRMLALGPRTILIDEADRNLDPKREGTGDLLAVINGGYKRGATRPVLVAGQGGTWEPKEMPTYAPVAMAGNAPHLPDDTRSRCIRVLLMTDYRGEAEETDWEELDPDATALRDDLAECINQAQERIGVKPDLPEGCRGRMAEKWRPLARMAHAAGGHWVQAVNAAILRDIAETAAEREDGLVLERPALVLVKHLAEVWPPKESFVMTDHLVDQLVVAHPETWGEDSNYGRALTAQRFGRMLSQAFKVHSVRRTVGTRQVRGYARPVLDPVWRQFGLPLPGETDCSVITGRNTGITRNVVHEPATSPETQGTSRLRSGNHRNQAELDGSDGLVGSDRGVPETGGKCSHGFEPSTCIRCEAERRGVA